MSEETRKRIAVAVLAKLLEWATRKDLMVLWADWTNGRVLFKINPSSETVKEVLDALAQAGVAGAA